MKKSNQINELTEKWEGLTRGEKIFVVEVMKTLYPEKKKLLSESKWYNTVGDIAGIFDPTGVVDLVNGISYWRQGDKLFAILSFIAALPIFGDIIAKPVVGVMKLGGEGAKAFKAATLTGDAVKVAGAAKSVGGPIAKMVEKSPAWGEKLITTLRSSIGKVPYLGSRFVNLLEEYVKLFTKASKEMGTTGKFKAFRGYEALKPSFLNRLVGGVPRIGGNAATRSLMRRSKWYLALLDMLGIHNFVGPDELEQKVTDIDQKVEKFNSDPKNKELFNSEFGGENKEMKPTPPTQPKTGSDPITALLAPLLGNAVKGLI